MCSNYLIGLLLVLFALTGCDQTSMMNKMAPSEDVALAQNYINQLRDNKYDLIERDLDPTLKLPNIHETLVRMAALIPAQQPISVKVVGVNVNNISMNGKTTSNTNITFEYQFPRKWLLANVATQKKDGGFSIIGFNITPIADSLENINRFTLTGKNALQYGVLSLAIIFPLFILYALVICIRTKIEKRKWLWIIFVLFGIGQLAVNWTTGQWSLDPLQFQLFGAGAFSPLFGAWTLSVSLPVGAIVFLLRRKKLMEAHSAAK